MRTTVELNEEQRAELLKLAAQRGMKGFSQLVQEAIDSYLVAQANRQSLIEHALDLKGIFKGKQADEFAERARLAHEHWR